MCILCEDKKGRVSIGRNLYVEFRWITPSQATIILDDHNKGNRNVKSKQVERIARDIRGGRWVSDTGEFCGFDKQMTLVNAQHRLLAIIDSGTKAGLWFIYGLPNTAQGVVDQAVKRSAMDMLTIKGSEKYAAVHASALRIMAAWENGWLWNAGQHTGRYNITQSELEEIHKLHPGLGDSAAWATLNRYELADITVSSLAFAHYLIGSVGGKHADPFWADLLTPERLDIDDPRRAMMKMFAESKNRPQGGRGLRGPNGIHIYGLITAWNMWLEGKPLKRMQYKASKTSDKTGVSSTQWREIPKITSVV